MGGIKDTRTPTERLRDAIIRDTPQRKGESSEAYLARIKEVAGRVGHKVRALQEMQRNQLQSSRPPQGEKERSRRLRQLQKGRLYNTPDGSTG